MNGARPIEIVASHLEIVHGAPPKIRAKCPAHGSKAGTLAIREASDGKVLMRCFAGCTLDEILRAANLSASDLFPNSDSQREYDYERLAARRRFAGAPTRTVREELDRELAGLRALLRAENGYDRPLRSSDINGVRERVSRRLQLKPSALPAIGPFVWECAPFDDDPNWPALFMRALEEEVRGRWHWMYPEAAAWETDPNGPGFYDRIRAEKLAREWQRAMAA